VSQPGAGLGEAGRRSWRGAVAAAVMPIRTNRMTSRT
jgi:hypothetical protein